MTIPSIKGNGKGFSIKNDFLPKIQDVSVQESSVSDLQASSDSQSPSSVQEQSQPQVGIDKDSSDYSIKKFQKDYRELVYNKVIPEIAVYEAERKKRLAGAVIGAVVLIILGIVLFMSINGRGAGDAAALCIGGAFALWAWLKKSFEKKIKKVIMPTLMQAIPGFYWQEKPPVTSEDISAAKLFPNDKSCSKTFDDCFLGKYRGVEVLMSECSYEIHRNKHTYTVFNGVVIRMSMNKSFEGITVVRPKTVEVTDCSDLKKAHLEQVVLEDKEFNDNFSIYSTDQIESRYLLTTAFMERLKNLTSAFVSLGTFCSFHDKYIYLAPYTTGDLFNLCSLTKPITNSKQFEILFDEFVSILQFVDHFKLDKKLGL